MKNFRCYSLFDHFYLKIDQTLRAIANNPKTTGRKYPADIAATSDLSKKEYKHIAGLMRINHAGEVCAQALYHGQGLASTNPVIKDKMLTASIEEGDHLAWCHLRLIELGSHASYLNPFWYAGAFSIGFAAGLIGDQWSLGFLAETESQVVAHLQTHLDALKKDQRSFSILKQMQQDEEKHRDEAIMAGAKELPLAIKKIMRWTAKIMVKAAYYV